MMHAHTDTSLPVPTHCSAAAAASCVSIKKVRLQGDNPCISSQVNYSTVRVSSVSFCSMRECSLLLCASYTPVKCQCGPCKGALRLAFR
jgi:hypothetical protein